MLSCYYEKKAKGRMKNGKRNIRKYGSSVA